MPKPSTLNPQPCVPVADRLRKATEQLLLSERCDLAHLPNTHTSYTRPAYLHNTDPDLHPHPHARTHAPTRTHTRKTDFVNARLECNSTDLLNTDSDEAEMSAVKFGSHERESTSDVEQVCIVYIVYFRARATSFSLTSVQG